MKPNSPDFVQTLSEMGFSLLTIPLFDVSVFGIEKTKQRTAVTTYRVSSS